MATERLGKLRPSSFMEETSNQSMNEGKAESGTRLAGFH